MVEPRPRYQWLAVIGFGLGLGILSWGGDELNPETPWRAVALIANLAAPWVLAGFLVGRRIASGGLGALGGGLACLLGIATYYVLHLLTGTRGAVGSQGVALWVAVGALVGPLMGFCGGITASRPGRPPLLAVALPGGALLAEALWLTYATGVWRLDRFGWIDMMVIVGLVLLATWIAWRFIGDRSRFLPCMGLVVLLAIGGSAVFAAIRLTLLI
jgi:hypothetical protein